MFVLPLRSYTGIIVRNTALRVKRGLCLRNPKRVLISAFGCNIGLPFCCRLRRNPDRRLMSSFVDSIEGIIHFLTDSVPEGLPTVAPKPRNPNIWRQDVTPVVSKVTAQDDLGLSIRKSLDLIGDLGKLAGPADTIMVKPNFNSPDPYPGSTDLEFLRIVLSLLKDTGARIVVGESSGGMWRPTRKTLSRVGLAEMLSKMGVELMIFDDHPRDWVHIAVDGDYLRRVTMPRSAYESTKLVYIPCLKTHKLARFSLSLKLAVGFLHPGERRAMHRGSLENKVVEINLAWQPDLIIMDGRKAFISGGPATGKLAEPGIIMASGDMIAIDVEGLDVLLSYGEKNRLPPNPWDSAQIVTASRHALGSRQGEYRLISE